MKAVQAVLWVGLLCGAPAMAQEPTPLPPPLEDAPEAPDEPPQMFSEQSAPVDPETARRVAWDAYLGGQGVLGPVPSLVAFAAFLAPVMGGLAGGWALEQAEPMWGGRWVQSTVAALSVVLVRELGSRVAGAVLSPLLLVLELPALAVLGLGGVASLYLLSQDAATTGALAPYLVGMGAGYVLLAPALLLGMVFLPLTTMLTRWLSVVLADLIFQRFVVDRQPQRTDDTRDVFSARLPQERPLDLLFTAGLVAAATSGRWERTAFWEHLPIIGPWIAVSGARAAMAERIGDARKTAGWNAGPDMQMVVDTLVASRALLLTMGMGLVLALPVIFAGVGSATMGVGVLFALGVPTATAVAMVAALALAYMGFLVVAGAAASVGAVALLGSGVLQDFIPWVLGAVAVGWERAPLKAEDAP